jgi:hypothetical protein
VRASVEEAESLGDGWECGVGVIVAFFITQWGGCHSAFSCCVS